jgi:hypothetical protein
MRVPLLLFLSSSLLLLPLQLSALTGQHHYHYAQALSGPDSFQTGIETSDYWVELNMTGSPIIFDKPGQAAPILANGSDYTFNILFKDKDDLTTTLKNVDYDVVVLAGDKELPVAGDQPSPSRPLHTATGNATMQHRFENTGLYQLKISILAVDSRPAGNGDDNSAGIWLQVEDSRSIPEFTFTVAQLVAIASAIGLVIVAGVAMQRRGSLPFSR